MSRRSRDIVDQVGVGIERHLARAEAELVLGTGLELHAGNGELRTGIGGRIVDLGLQDAADARIHA